MRSDDGGFVWRRWCGRVVEVIPCHILTNKIYILIA